MNVFSKLKSKLLFVQTQYCSVYRPTLSLFLSEKLFIAGSSFAESLEENPKMIYLVFAPTEFNKR